MSNSLGTFTARKVASQSDTLFAASIYIMDRERVGGQCADWLSDLVSHVKETASEFAIVGFVEDNPTCASYYDVDGLVGFYSIAQFTEQEFAGLLTATETIMLGDGIGRLTIRRDSLDMLEDQVCKNHGYEFTEEMEPVQYARKALVSPVIPS